MSLSPEFRTGLMDAARALQVDPVDLATVISYETAGTFDPAKRGPTTQWGQHRGLIQFGEPQAKQYGVDWNRPLESQLGADGAVVRYLTDRGFKPGGSLLDLYSTINAGAPGLYDRTDANNGGAPGTVREKVEQQFAPHRDKAARMLAQAETGTMNDARPVTDKALIDAYRAAREQQDATPRPVTDPDLVKAYRSARGQGAAEMPSASPIGPDQGALAGAATTMVNDINAGFQGANPVSVSQGKALGMAVRDAQGQIIGVEGSVDGMYDGPLAEWMTPERVVVQADPQTGREMLYQRTPDMAESPLASAGRVVGQGMPTALAGAAGRALKADSITPSLGATGPIGGAVAGAMDASVVTRGPAVADAQRFYGEMEDTAALIAREVGGGATQNDMAGALREGAEIFKDTFTKRADDLYSAVPIPADAPVAAAKTTGQLKSFVDLFADKPNLAREVGLSKFSGWLEDMAGGLTWEQARALRSEVGAAIGSIKGPLASKADGQLKSIYASLTRDLDAAAQAAGPDAFRAYKRADQFYRAGADRLKGALDFLFKPGAAEGQTAGAFMDLLKEGGRRENIGKLMTIKRSMPPAEWQTVVGTAIRRMGAPSGASTMDWSAAQFWTNWNNMAPTARRAFFEGKGLPPRLYEEMTALAEVARRAKQAEGLINRSRSGATAADLGTGAAFYLTPDVALATSAAAYLTARALTMPTVLRAVRTYEKSGSVGVLQKLAQSGGPEAIEAGTILRAIEQQGAQSGTATPARAPLQLAPPPAR